MRGGKLTPHIEAQLKKLKQIPVNKIGHFMTPIVDIPIENFSLRDSHRALYILSSTLVNVKEQTDVLVGIFEKREIEIEQLIKKYESDDKMQTFVIDDLKTLLIDEAELVKRMDEQRKIIREKKEAIQKKAKEPVDKLDKVTEKVTTKPELMTSPAPTLDLTSENPRITSVPKV